MSTYSVKVSDIAPSTKKEHLNEFFSFCGKISSIEFESEEPKKAVIHFEKPSAAKTALMLNGGTLDGAQLVVTSETVHPDEDDSPHPDGEPFHQSDKPRAGIAAEYLARGYILSDQVLQRAIEIDQKQGISQRFLNYIQSLDTSVGARTLGPDQTVSGRVQSAIGAATEQARAVDQQRGISKTATDYYSRAISSPLGKRIFDFYTSTSKQVLDIHEEARRIADQQKANNSQATPATPGAAPTST